MRSNNYHEGDDLTLDIDTLVRATNISYGLPTDEAIRVCKHRYKNEIAKLTIQISDPTVTKIMKDVKMSFSGMLGVVGGTLGLFTGVSLVSIVEALFWIYKTIRRIFKCSSGSD